MIPNQGPLTYLLSQSVASDRTFMVCRHLFLWKREGKIWFDLASLESNHNIAKRLTKWHCIGNVFLMTSTWLCGGISCLGFKPRKQVTCVTKNFEIFLCMDFWTLLLWSRFSVGVCVDMMIAATNQAWMSVAGESVIGGNLFPGI